MTVRLGELTSTDLTTRPIVVVPLGSCEQHGPHLPLDTDTRIAVAVAERFAASRTDVVVAPSLSVTASGEHAGFAGTLSIGLEVLESLVVELCRSADWADGIVLVNGHGGNTVAVRRAVSRVEHEGRRVLSWWPRLSGDAHAGRTETSLLLAIAPELVRLDRAEVGRTEPLGELIDDLRSGGVRAVSPNGVLGDPTSASADEGHHLLDAMVDDLTVAVATWRAHRV